MAYDDRLPRSPSSSVIEDGHGRNFERARTTVELHGDLGDSERWGGSDTMILRVPAGNNPFATRVDSQQLVRVQMKNGYARRWAGTFSWHTSKLSSSGNYVSLVGLGIVWAVGQGGRTKAFFQAFEDASGTLFYQSGPSASAAVPQQVQAVPVGSMFAVSPSDGVVILPEIPATSITVVASWSFTDNLARANAYEIHYDVHCAFAPRAL